MKTLLWIVFGAFSCSVLAIVSLLIVTAGMLDAEKDRAMRQRRGSGP
jgi:hypothetical protein